MIRHLLVPGLFGAARQGDEDLLIPRLPRLEKILARADRQPGAVGYLQTAFALFGQSAEPGADLPTAPLCYAQETQTTPSGWWMHADPVHLRPDQDRLILFDGRMLEIGASEAEDCVAAFNAHFAGEGLQLLAAQPTRWYLKLAAPPGVVTTPLNDVTGRNVNHFLPRGERRSHWCRLLNEVQMLFHHLSVNQQREARGLAPINGLW